MAMSNDRWPGSAEEVQLVANVQPPGFAPVTKGILNEIVRRIVSGVRPEKIILFGSYGYGSPTNDSDVDLLIIMETSDRPADRYLAVSRLIRPRPFPLDILVKTPAEITQALEKGDFFIREIVTKGQTLYERPN
jgi:predicted nucleotidyltransferase